MSYDENSNQHCDLVQINDSNEKNSIIIYAHQLNQYYHTLLGNPFERLKYYNSIMEEYQFYRTPGILQYIITYYLHQGCLSTEIHYPVEILYDELVFFGFNIQIIYEIVSSLITIDYYIPSGKYRRAFWFQFNHDIPRKKIPFTRILNGLITICSIITSLIFLEISNNSYYQKKFILNKTLITEMIILIYSYLELFLQYFIRPKLVLTMTFFLILINSISLIPFALLLFIWSMPSNWLYYLLVIQLAARIFRSIRLFNQAYEIIFALTERLRIYVESFEIIALIILFFALLILAFEQISSPMEFLFTKQVQSLSEIIWISVNAFTALGEGRSRPMTFAGLIIEFLTCLLGVLVIPQIAQMIYTIVSNTIDKQKMNEEKRKNNHLVLIEDEHGNKAIGQVNVDQHGYWSLPEILIQKDDF